MAAMNANDRRALICHLVASMREEDSWTGETQIQKSVMFLQRLLGVPLGYDFVLYLHGPFSFELRSELTLMRARLHLDVESRAHYGASFTLGPRGKTVHRPSFRTPALDRLRCERGFGKKMTFAPLRDSPQPTFCRTTIRLSTVTRSQLRSIGSSLTSVSKMLAERSRRSTSSCGRRTRSMRPGTP